MTNPMNTANPNRVMHEVMQHLAMEIKDELVQQGHYNTGALHKSIEYFVRTVAGATIGQIFMNDYWRPLETGVPASRVPYSKGSGAKSSKYIDGLIAYFKSKGLDVKEAKSAAFATANKHKQEGMPTANSYTFSKNSRRTDFLSQVAAENMDLVEMHIQDELEGALTNILKRIAA